MPSLFVLCVGQSDGHFETQLPGSVEYIRHWLRAVFNMLVKNGSPRGLMCFRCLMFSLSGPCDFFIFTLFYCLLDLSCGEFDVISLYFMCCPVNGSVYLMCFVFDRVSELFGETIHNMFRCGCYLVVKYYGSV